MPEPDWKRYGYSSFEAYVESKAGACPPEVDGGPDWPMPDVPDWCEEESDDPDSQ